LFFGFAGWAHAAHLYPELMPKGPTSPGYDTPPAVMERR